MPIALQALSLVEKAEPVQVHFTLHLRDQWSKWMQDGYKVYMDSYMAWNGSCFMVTWTISENQLLEVGLTHGETMALLNITLVPTWIEIHGISIWLRARPHLTSHYTWGHVTTLHDFGSVLGQLLDTSFGLSQFHDHGSWLVCEVTLNWPWIWSPKC